MLQNLIKTRIMICPKCKATVKEGTKFCSTCGTEIPQHTICPQCGKELKDNMKFCPNCGYEVLVGSISEKEEMRFDSGDSNDNKEKVIISKETPNNNDKASEPNTIVEDDTPLDDAGIALMKKWMIGTYIASFAGIFIFFSMGGFSSSIWWWITFVVFVLVALATYGLKDDKTKKTLDALKGMAIVAGVICVLILGCMGNFGMSIEEKSIEYGRQLEEAAKAQDFERIKEIEKESDEWFNTLTFEEKQRAIDAMSSIAPK